jgi:hypothetical protein
VSSRRWQKRCLACGKIESGGMSSSRPSGTPIMSGKCPNTSSGKHNPVYEEV